MTSILVFLCITLEPRRSRLKLRVRWALAVPARGLLVGVGNAQDRAVFVPATGQHEPNGQAGIGEAARDRDGGLAGEIEDAGVLPALATMMIGGIRDGTRGNSGSRHGKDIDALHDFVHVASEEFAPMLGFGIVTGYATGKALEASRDTIAEAGGLLAPGFPPPRRSTRRYR